MKRRILFLILGATAGTLDRADAPAPDAADTPQAALQLALANTDRVQKAEKINQIGGDWARKDPAAAIAYADKLDSYVARTRYLTSVMSSWLMIDAPSAEKWLGGLADTGMRYNIASESAGTWAASDLAGATSFFEAMPPGHARKAFLDELVRVRAQKDPGAAVQWASRLAPGERLEPEVSAMILWSMADPAAAGKYLSGEPQDPLIDRSLNYVAANWARTNPHAALDWLGTFPDGEARDKADGDLFTSWVMADRASAEAWLRGLPAGHLHDTVCQKYAQYLNFRETASACGWAAQIGDGEMRHNAERMAFRDWLRKDPAAAKPKLSASDLPDNDKQDLLRMVR